MLLFISCVTYTMDPDIKIYPLWRNETQIEINIKNYNGVFFKQPYATITLSYNALLINHSTVFFNLKLWLPSLHHKDSLIYYGETDKSDEFRELYWDSFNLPTWVRDSLSVLLFWISFYLLILVFVPSGSPPLRNSNPL